MTRRWFWVIPPMVSLALYAGVLHQGFVFDDWEIVEIQLPRFKGLLDPLLHYRLLLYKTFHYRPLAWWSWMVSARLGGGTPFAFHLIPWLLHAGNTLLVSVLAYRFLVPRQCARAAALAAALLFAVHPAHVEVVAWSAAITDGWLTLCALASLLAYHRYRRGGERAWWLWASALLFFCALLAKETALAMLCVYPLYDLLPARDLRAHAVWHRLRWYLPFVLVCAVYLMLRYYNLHAAQFGRLASPAIAHAGVRAFSAYGYYLRKCLFPVSMDIYTTQVRTGPAAVLGGLLSLCGCCWLIVRTWRPHPVVCFHALFFLVALAPAAAATVFTVSLTPLAERYLYLPSYGPVVLAGWAVGWCLSTAGHWWTWRSAAALLAGLGICLASVVAVRQRVPVWNEGRVFWEYAVRHHPTEMLPYVELVKVAAMDNDCARAAAYFEQARLRKAPRDYWSSFLYLYYGLCLHRTGQLDAAERLYEQSLTVFKTPETYVQLGNIWLARAAASPAQRPDLLTKANDACAAAHRLDPANYQATLCLGMMHEAQGSHTAEAIAYYRQTVHLAPANDSVAHEARAALARLAGEVPR